MAGAGLDELNLEYVVSEKKEGLSYDGNMPQEDRSQLKRLP
jgi:hypothetical protein